MYTTQKHFTCINIFNSQNKHEVGIIFLFLWVRELSCQEVNNYSTYLPCHLISMLMTFLPANPLMASAS